MKYGQCSRYTKAVNAYNTVAKKYNKETKYNTKLYNKRIELKGLYAKDKNMYYKEYKEAIDKHTKHYNNIWKPAHAELLKAK